MTDAPSDIVSSARELAGESFRVAAVYDENDYEILFERSDVTAKYDPPETDAIYEEMILEGIEHEYLESLFHTGDLQSSTAIFEEAVIMHFAAPNHRGLFLSFDASQTLPVVEIANLGDAWIEDPRTDGIPIEEA
jgi:hypothetical protein